MQVHKNSVPVVLLLQLIQLNLRILSISFWIHVQYYHIYHIYGKFWKNLLYHNTTAAVFNTVMSLTVWKALNELKEEWKMTVASADHFLGA